MPDDIINQTVNHPLSGNSRRSGRRILIWATGFFVLLLPVLGLTVYHLLQTSQADARAADLAIPVQTAPATVQDLENVVGGAGIIQPSMPLNLTAKIEARVARVPVDQGTVVKPGDTLVEFDPELYRANLESARLSYAHYHNELRRVESLAKLNYASPVDLENARIAEARAQVALVSAKLDLANTILRSPVSAVVLSRSINPGEMSRIDEAIMQLGVISPILMEVAIGEDKIGFVYPGMDAVVETDAFPGRTFVGRVARLDSSVDVMTRAFEVYVEIPNHDLQLKKGITGYARLTSRRVALVVPSTAVLNPVGDRATVYVVDSGRAHSREIRPGLSTNGVTEILAGLNEGERVVSVGQAGLRDNDTVRVNHNASWND